MRKIDKIFDFEVACDVNDGQLRKVIESNLGVVVGVDLSSFSSWGWHDERSDKILIEQLKLEEVLGLQC